MTPSKLEIIIRILAGPTQKGGNEVGHHDNGRPIEGVALGLDLAHCPRRQVLLIDFNLVAR